MMGLPPTIFAAAVVQKSKKLHDNQIGAAHSADLQAPVPDPRPVPRAVYAPPIQNKVLA